MPRVKPLQRLDALAVGVLHALEEDHTAARRVDLGVEDFEHIPNAERLDLVLDQALNALFEGLLDLTHANGAKPRFGYGLLNQ
jgi:hypothetical protein